MSDTQGFGFDSAMRVVVIDDVQSARRIVRRLLEKMGFTNIVEVEDSTKALAKIKEAPTGLVISDWNMPGIPGIDLVKNLRNDAELSSVPFIMITSSSDKEAVVEAFEAGASDYVLKPFGFDTLVEKVKGALKL
ncbi:MAG: response regulator [Oligoflexia bacterium]|nr:response regulator [Oligoflexia bacterium]